MKKILFIGLIFFLLATAQLSLVHADNTNGSDVEPVNPIAGGTNGSPSLTVPANGGTSLGAQGTVPVSQQTVSSGASVNPSFVGTNGNLNYVPLEPLPSGFISDGNAYSDGNVASILNAFIKIAIIGGGFLAVALFVFYGIRYMLTDVVGTKSDAKDHLKNAFWGLLLLLGSYLILYTINPQLLNFSNVFCPLTGVTGGCSSTGSGAAVSQTSTQPSSATIQQNTNTCTSAGGSMQNGTCQGLPSTPL
jgi:hypothetical protein